MYAIEERDDLMPSIQQFLGAGYGLASAIFELKEFESFYLLAIDLPSLEDTEIAAGTDQKNIQRIEVRKHHKVPQVFFRCETVGTKVKSYYQDGVLWVVLPKGSFLDCLDIPRIERSIYGSLT